MTTAKTESLRMQLDRSASLRSIIKQFYIFVVLALIVLVFSVMKPTPPISVVYSVVIGCNPITGYFNILFVKPCDHAERTTGKALAKCTVAYVSTNRFALYAVSDRSTHTPSAMNLGHFHPLRLIEL